MASSKALAMVKQNSSGSINNAGPTSSNGSSSTSIHSHGRESRASESDSEPIASQKCNPNQSWNRNCDKVSVSEPESGYTTSSMKTPQKYFFLVKNCLFSRNRNRNAETLGSHPGIRIGIGIDV